MAVTNSIAAQLAAGTLSATSVTGNYHSQVGTGTIQTNPLPVNPIIAEKNELSADNETFILWLSGALDVLSQIPPSEEQWDVVRAKIAERVGGIVRHRMKLTQYEARANQERAEYEEKIRLYTAQAAIQNKYYAPTTATNTFGPGQVGSVTPVPPGTTILGKLASYFPSSK